MPLLKFDLLKSGWTDKTKLKTMLDIAYATTLTAFKAPKGDRYQIVSLHGDDEMIIEDTGLGFTRSQQVIVLSIRTRPRTVAEKEQFYQLFVTEVNQKLGIAKNDVMINMVENTDADWSFGGGQAQFLTGDL